MGRFCKVFSSMNERFRRELVVARLRQRREQMAAAAVGIQGERREEMMSRVQGLDISPAEAREALQSLHSRERRGVDGAGSSPAPISTAEFLEMSGRVRSPVAAPSSQDWEIVQGADVVEGVRRGSALLSCVSKAAHRFALGVSASAVRAGIDAIAEDLVQQKGALKTTNRPFVMPPADVPGFALGITTDYGIMQVVDFRLGGEDSHSGMLGLDPEPEDPPFPFRLRLEHDRCSWWDFPRMLEGALPPRRQPFPPLPSIESDGTGGEESLMEVYRELWGDNYEKEQGFGGDWDLPGYGCHDGNCD